MSPGAAHSSHRRRPGWIKRGVQRGHSATTAATTTTAAGGRSCCTCRGGRTDVIDVISRCSGATSSFPATITQSRRFINRPCHRTICPGAGRYFVTAACRWAVHLKRNIHVDDAANAWRRRARTNAIWRKTSVVILLSSQCRLPRSRSKSTIGWHEEDRRN